MSKYKYIVTYEKAKSANVGNKFFQLADLNSLTNTPQAVCITSEAFYDSLPEESWGRIKDKLELLKSNGGYRLGKMQKEIANELSKLAMPNELVSELRVVYKKISSNKTKQLITRSSSHLEDGEKSSGAGVYESYPGINSFNDLLKGICVCWKSAFSLSAISHRLRINEFNIMPLPGVIIQQFVKAELSGVVFSRNPLGGTQGKFIEYTTDGSDGIESGTGVSNSFVAIQKPGSNGYLINQTDFPRQILDELLEVSEKLVVKYSKDMEFEWAISKGQLYVLQTRPITTELESKSSNTKSSVFDLHDLYLESNAINKKNLGDIKGIYEHSISKRKQIRLFALKNKVLINGSAVIFTNKKGLDSVDKIESQVLDRLHTPIFTIDLGPYLRSFYTERSLLKETVAMLVNRNNVTTPIIVREFASGEYSAVSIPENDKLVTVEICKGSLIGINRGFVETNSYQVDLENRNIKLSSETITSSSRYCDFDYEANAFLLKESANEKTAFETNDKVFFEIAEFTVKVKHELGLNILEWTVLNGKPVFIDNTPLSKLEVSTDNSSSTRFLSPGKINGRALLIDDLDKLEYISSGPTLNVNGNLPTIESNKEILELLELVKRNDDIVIVSKFPYTALSVLVGKVKGFVFESGPVLCHLAIISREEKTPIAIVDNAMLKYKNNQQISIS